MAKRLRASSVCEAEGQLLLVRLRDPITGVEGVYPPGGGVEADETPAETARRETLEETGLRVRVDPAIEVVDRYPFCWAGVDYDVTTHYLAASLEEPAVRTLPAVVDADYNLGALWMPTEEALAAMGTHPRIAAAVERVLCRAARAGWERHPNFGGPASTLLAIHDQFRAAAERLSLLSARDEAGTRGSVARAFAPLASTLHHHHRAEEVMLFPVVLARTGAEPARLIRDHEELTEAITAVERTLAAPEIERFARVLGAHLDREERLVVPVLLAMTAAEAWAQIHRE